MKIIKYFIYCIKYYFLRKQKYTAKWVEDIPEKLNSNSFYIVGTKKHPFKLVSKCPAKLCNHLVQVKVLKDENALNEWRITEHQDNTISLYPSVWITRKCGCHYWIEKGKLRWCNQLSYKNWLSAIKIEKHNF